MGIMKHNSLNSLPHSLLKHYNSLDSLELNASAQCIVLITESGGIYLQDIQEESWFSEETIIKGTILALIMVFKVCIPIVVVMVKVRNSTYGRY